MVTRILILGATGMLGHRLMQRCAARYETFGTLRQAARTWQGHPAFAGARLLGGVQAERPETIAMAMDLAEPEVVVNCIGLIKQRHDGNDPVPALQVNGILPHLAARWSAERGARFIHLSTDCVFSGGLGRPYSEADPADPADVYGRSKLAGEVTEAPALTLRTSMIGWEIGRRTGLLEWAAAQAGQPVNGFTRALFSGFTTGALADLILDVIGRHPGLAGLWHVAAPPISKHELLERLNRVLDLRLQIAPQETPMIDRRLDDRRFRAETGLPSPAWDAMLAQLAREPRFEPPGTGP